MTLQEIKRTVQLLTRNNPKMKNLDQFDLTLAGVKLSKVHVDANGNIIAVFPEHSLVYLPCIDDWIDARQEDLYP